MRLSPPGNSLYLLQKPTCFSHCFLLVYSEIIERKKAFVNKEMIRYNEITNGVR